MLRRSIQLALTLTILSSVAIPAHAAEVGEEIDLNKFLNIEVTAATKRKETARTAPATVLVITEDDIKNRGYQNLYEALNDLPGMSFRRMTLAETGQNELRVRGIPGNNKIAYLLNGTRIHIAPKAEDHQLAEDWPLNNVKRIEVAYGPASALYGADAMSAVVNVVTYTGKELDGLRLQGSYGLVGQTSDAISYGAELGEESSLLLFGRFYHTGYDDLMNDPQYKLNNGKSYLENWPDPKVMDNSITANNQFVSFQHRGLSLNIQRYQKDMPAAPLSRDFRYYNNQDGRWKDAVTSVTMGYDANFDVVKSNTMLTYENFSLDPSTRFYWNSEVGAGPTTDPASKSAIAPGYKYGLGHAARLEQTFTRDFSEDFSLVGGLTLEDFDGVPQTTDFFTPIDPNQSLTGQMKTSAQLGQIPPGVTDHDPRVGMNYAQYQNYGTYLQTELGFIPNLKTTLGARADYNTRYGQTFNPRAGLVYQLSDATTLKALYGTSFLAPSIEQAYLTWGVPGVYMHHPNPDLKPQQGQTFEVSAIQTFGKNLSLTGTVYQNNINDLIVIDHNYTAPVLGVSTFGERFVNAANAVSRGAELRVDTVVAGQHAYGGASYVDTTQTTGGTTTALPDVVPLMLKGGIDLKPLSWLTLTPRVTWESGRTTLPTNTEFKGANMPGYVGLDLGARAQVLPNAEVFLTASNLLDQTYYANNADTDQAFTALDKLPQPGRRALLGVTYRF